MAELESLGWVYLLRKGNYYKIGRSIHPERRLRQLQTGAQEQLCLVHKIKCSTVNPLYVERIIHRWFWEDRVRGEWFSLSPSAVEFLKEFETDQQIYGTG